MARKGKQKARIEILNESFDVYECIDSSPSTPGHAGEDMTSVIPSGNVRVTFSSGAMIDVYVTDWDELHFASVYRHGYDDRLILVGKLEADFTMSVRSVKVKS